MKKNRIHPANKKSIASQRDKILKWLLKGKTITTLKAITQFGCTRLSARISEIRDMGHVIVTKWVKTRNKQVVKEYSLIQYQPEA
ncbi:helix-turn-helix domain-containing protein [Chitinophaga pinensis]|uniref:Winged helix-turn-helix domain-containing protein n=1 Tax=Chitinophaga pinensis (strain ATCC 43595 / DSM 2588 / LMG 13176 / NBRC 15968 / NCIMB 11800 / UQM 2034) TaxID=485918 RepID=A0A979G5L6_CHIPD|nr:helix-turn-helix domain-containing protein [Chitinophaga pinensis]ACU61314.1 hypothetical protein Cpin_3852 [Chitinophaga pinensis DSM 2588]